MFCKFACPDFGVRKAFFCMFIKRKKNRSGTVSIVVAEKISGYYKELITMGIARHQEEIDSLIMKGRKWIDAEQERRHPRLDLFGEERPSTGRT